MLTICRPLLLLLTIAGCASESRDSVDYAFCYRTLADVACYDRPDRGREASFVGAYELAAVTPADKAYWLKVWRKQEQELAEELADERFSD